MFFVANVCNNYAFDFNIPMPLHMIFRAVSINISYKYKIYQYPNFLIYIKSCLNLCLIILGFSDS